MTPSVAGLEDRDHRQVLAVLDEVSRSTDDASFASSALRGVAAVVPADVISLNEVDPLADRVVFEVHPPTWQAPPDTAQVLAELAHEHPLIRLYDETGDGSARKISDYLSEDEFHASALYQRLYGRMNVEDQMSITLPAPRPIIVAIAVSRSRRDFDERDRAVLNLLRPHLGQMWRMARERARLTELLETAGRVLSVTGHGAVALADVPSDVTPGALTTIYRYFGRPGTRSPLPPRVDRWLSHERSKTGRARALSAPLVARREGLTAVLRYLAPAGRHPEALLVRVEPGHPEFRDLPALGLSDREAEVLRLAASGAKNVEIAQSLHIATGTVKKHLDHVYAKLGVRSRSQAVAALLDITAHHG